MPTLSPYEAAKLAQSVYDLRTMTLSDAQKIGNLGFEGKFAVGNESTFKGVTGGLVFWKELTNFGYVAAGIGNYENEAVVVCRGTDIAADWCTDANIGATSGPSTGAVHAGFMSTFSTFSHELDGFFAKRKATTIHCVGHSLGGALAGLTAAHCAQRGYGKPELYTFGAPRIGLSAFAEDLTNKLTSARIHRVSNVADPVPMIPLWPYTHAPVGNPGMIVGDRKSGIISFGAHKMANYLDLVGQSNWATLAATTDSRSNGERVEDWLNGVAKGRIVITPMGAYSFKMLTKALRWVIEASQSLILGALGAVSMSVVTVLDQLAILLEKAVHVAEKIAYYVQVLLRAILKFAGYTANTTVELTKKFIGWALRLLFAPIRMMAKAATDSLKGG
jgi:triacylglycerol lipase